MRDDHPGKDQGINDHHFLQLGEKFIIALKTNLFQSVTKDYSCALLYYIIFTVVVIAIIIVKFDLL